MFPTLSIIEIAALSIAMLFAALAPQRQVLAAILMVTFIPLLRIEIPVLDSSIGVRAEDLMLAILAVRVGLTTGWDQRRASRFLLAYTILVGSLSASFLWILVAGAGNTPALYFVQKMTGSSVLLWVAWRLCREPQAIRWAVGGLLAGGFLMFCLVFIGPESSRTYVAESAAYYGQMYNAKFRNVERLAGWNPNVVGLSFGMLLMVAAGALAFRPSLRVRLIIMAASGAFAYGLVRSYTRTAMIGTAAALGYGLIRLAFLRRARLGFLTLAAMTGAACIGIWNVDLDAFQLDMAQGVNTGGRMVLWRAGLQTIADHPVGLGVGQAEKIFAGNTAFDSAHNDWLDFGLQIGIPGSFLAFITYVLLFGECRSATRYANPKAPFVAAEGLMVFFFAASLGLQVLTFQKQVFAVIAPLAAFVHLGVRPRSRSAARVPRRESVVAEASFAGVP